MKLAQVGSRLIDGAAKKMADDFFAAFSEAFMQDETVQDSQDVQADVSRKEPKPKRQWSVPRTVPFYLDYRLCGADHRHGARAMNVSIRVNGKSHSQTLRPTHCWSRFCVNIWG